MLVRKVEFIAKWVHPSNHFEDNCTFGINMGDKSAIISKVVRQMTEKIAIHSLGDFRTPKLQKVSVSSFCVNFPLLKILPMT